MKRNTK